MSTQRTVLAHCNPNRHGPVRLVRYESVAPEGHRDDPEFDAESVHLVESPGYGYASEDGGAEYLHEEDARVVYDEEVARLAREPNWAAQAEYDAEWGTINGYGAHQFGREY